MDPQFLPKNFCKSVEGSRIIQKIYRGLLFIPAVCIKNNAKKSWNLINRLINKVNNGRIPFSEFEIGGKLTENCELIAEGFNDYFVNIGKNLAEKISDSNKSFSSYMQSKQIINSCAFYLSTPLEIMDIVKSLKNSFSAGIDEISVNLLKCIIESIAEPISALINIFMNKGMFPDKMKIAKVCPIFKSGEKSKFINYRPISILPSFSKIFEKVIARRLLSFIKQHDILSPSQFGFREAHSTSMALMNFYDKVTEAISKGEFCIGILIDLSKAFDTIDHDILFKKIRHVWH